MTKAAKTFRPPWAVTAWIEKSSIFIELPCTEGPPYIQQYSMTEGGLSSALTAMRDLYNRKIVLQPSYPTKRVYDRIAKPRQPSVRARSRQFSPEQRATALEVLKRMKLVP